MKNYVFSNKGKRIVDVLNKLLCFNDLKIVNCNKNTYTLSNTELVINVDRKRTCILLIKENCNISEIRKYYMEN